MGAPSRHGRTSPGQDQGMGVPSGFGSSGPSNPDADREALFGRGGGGAAKAPQSEQERFQQGADRTKDLMGQNLQAAHERGDKISQIADQSEELAKASGGFR